MKNKIITLIFIINIFLITFALTGCSNNQNKDEYNNDLNSKVEEEIEYIDNKIFGIFLKLEKNEYMKTSKDNVDEIDWDKIQDDVLLLDENFNTMFLDLTLEELNVKKEELSTLRNELNNVIEVIRMQNEVALISSLNNYYTELVNIYSKYSKDTNNIIKKQVKANVLKSYVQYLNKSPKEEILNTFNTAINKYNDAMNDYNYVEQNKYNLNKIYIILQEYKKELESEKEINDDFLKIKIIEFLEEI